jgi:4'-phosphopantetheinyl transferase
METLASDRADIWYLESNTALLDLNFYGSLLDADERFRQEKLRTTEGRCAFTVAHAFCRIILSKYSPVRPKDCIFRHNRFGRPEIANQHDSNRLRFSLSRSRGLIACAIRQDYEVGVDVEIVRDSKLSDIADRYFN